MAGFRILVVDDWKESADSLGLYLHEGGHEVKTVYSAEHALEAVREFAPEVVFLDLTMPHTDGFVIARNLNFRTPRPYLIAYTASGEKQDRERVQDAGFDAHLIKPVGADQIDAALINMKRKRTRLR